MPRKDHGSKWTGEFLVAGELSRRGYTVAFTQGSHTPGYDLIVGTKSGEAFTVDVKGMATKGAWLVTDKPLQKGLFYILALVPPCKPGGRSSERKDRFFVLSQKEAITFNQKYKDEHPNQKDHGMSGFDWRDAEAHEDRWDKLPHTPPG